MAGFPFRFPPERPLLAYGRGPLQGSFRLTSAGVPVDFTGWSAFQATAGHDDGRLVVLDVDEARKADGVLGLELPSALHLAAPIGAATWRWDVYATDPQDVTVPIATGYIEWTAGVADA